MEGFEHYTPKEHLSPSSLCNFARCPRRFFFSNGCNLCSKAEIPAFVFGEAIHKGLPWAFRGDLDKALEEFQSVWREELDDDKRNKHRARLMFWSFSTTVPKDLFQLIPPLQQVGEEVSQDETTFAVDVGAHLPFVGRIDAIAQHRDRDEYWAVEYKTSSQLGSTFMTGFELNPQVLSYALAVSTMTTKPVGGTLLIGLLVAKKSQNTLCLPIRIRKHLFKSTVKWIQLKAAEIYACEQAQEFPQNFSLCNPYSSFGMPGYTCEYQPLCLEENWTKLKEMFHVASPHTVKIPDASISNE